MTHHRWLYRITLILLTLMVVLPQAYYTFEKFELLYYWGFNNLNMMIPSIPGFTSNNVSYSRYLHRQMWRGMFVSVEPNRELLLSRPAKWQTVNDYVLAFRDRETDEKIGDAIPLKTGMYRSVVLDDRLFLLGGVYAPGTISESYEFVDGKLRPFNFIWPEYDPVVLIEEKLFRLQRPISGRDPIATTVESGALTPPQTVVLPSFANPDWGQQPTYGWMEVVQCLTDESTIYTFVSSEKKLYFRVGITLRSSADPAKMKTYGTGGAESQCDPLSDDAWQRVRDQSKEAPNVDLYSVAIVDGRPTALVVAQLSSHRPTGFLYRLDAGEWKEYATIHFPLGSKEFRLVTPGAGIPPYVVAQTSTGTGFAYQSMPDGVAEVKGQGPALTWKYVKQDLLRNAWSYGWIIGLGFLPCLLIWLMSSFFLSADYSFGVSTVRLASLGHRAVAKFVDALFLSAVFAAIAWIVLRNVNWFELAEAWNLAIPHPDLRKLTQAAIVEVIATSLASILLILMQGFWCVTPGKWLCGLRTLRKTLRPCGFARSLAREVLLAIDSTYLLWWVPGSLSIGLTDHRQRLGDLVSDTIVVTARSMKPAN